MTCMEDSLMTDSRPESLPALDNGSGAAPVIVQYSKAMKQQTPIAAVLLIALLLPLGLFATAEAPGMLHLDGILLLRGDRSSMGRVIITAVDAPETVMENVEGHFTLDLLLEQAYMLSFERSGMVTKRVYFDTHVPAEELARRFEFPFQVSLFTEGSNGINAYDGPVGYVHYLDEVRGFVHRTEYQVAPGGAMEERIAGLMARGLAAPILVMPLRTAFTDDLQWAKHGKRGPLFIGKAFAPDGHLIAEGQFLDARLQEMHGAFVFYYPDGQVESQGRYEHGHKSGVWQRFDAGGRPLAERIYDPRAMERIDRSVAATAVVGAPALEPGRTMHIAVGGREISATPSNAAPERAPTVRSVTVPAVPRPEVIAVAAKGDGLATGPHIAADDMRTLGTSEPGRSVDVVVERLRVITVVRLQGATGHITEYRRVADRHGSVMYFEDGRNIPASIYHARTGR